MTSSSTHIDLDTLETRIDQVAEAAHTLGHQYVGRAIIPEQRRKTLDDYKKMADELNAIGGARQRARVQHSHNHGYGFTPLEGQVPTRSAGAARREYPHLKAMTLVN